MRNVKKIFPSVKSLNCTITTLWLQAGQMCFFNCTTNATASDISCLTADIWILRTYSVYPWANCNHTVHLLQLDNFIAHLFLCANHQTLPVSVSSATDPLFTSTAHSLQSTLSLYHNHGHHYISVERKIGKQHTTQKGLAASMVQLLWKSWAETEAV